MRAVLFDFSGTLFDDTSVVTPDRLVGACAARGRTLPHAEASRACTAMFAAVDSAEGRAARADADLSPVAHRRIWTGLARSARGCDATVAEAFYDCVVSADGWRAYPDAPGVLHRLAAAGIPVGVLSNTGWDIRGSFRVAGLDALVTTYVLSCEVGIAKPAPEIFRLGCERLEMPPGQTLMVGDDAGTDGGAAAAGLPVYLLPKFRDIGRPRGLGAIPKLLSALEG